MTRRAVLPLIFALVFGNMLAALPPAAAQETELPGGYVGTWAGTGTQTNPGDEWTITLTLTAGPVGSVVGTVDYSELACGGELIFLGPAAEVEGVLPSIQLSEDITYGENACIDGGAFELWLLSDTLLSFYWQSPDGTTTAGGKIPLVGASASDETGTGRVMVWTMTCPDTDSTETGISVTAQLINVDPGPTCYGVESPLSFTITDAAGTASTYTTAPPDSLEFDLPFGTYTITENDSGARATFDLSAHQGDPEYCLDFAGCALVIVGVPVDSGTGQTPVESFEVPESYLGTWEGSGTQTNPEIDWPITISLTGGAYGDIVGTVDYPTLGCGGELILNRVDFDDFFLDISEDITYGEDNCIANGLFTIEAPSDEADETMEFQWGTPDSSSRADGLVTRVSGQGGTSDWQQTIWEGLTISYPPGNTFFSESNAAIGPPVRAIASLQPDDCIPGADCPILGFRLNSNEGGLSASDWANRNGLIARNFRDATIAGQPGIAFETGNPDEYPGESSTFIAPVGAEILEISGVGYEQEVIERIVASITVSAPPSGEALLPIEFGGTWTGTAQQYENIEQGALEETYPVELMLTAGAGGAVVGSIDYSTLGCGGELTWQDMTEDSITLGESITYDNTSDGNACADGASMILHFIGDQTLAWEWFWPDGSLGAEAMLTKPVTSNGVICTQVGEVITHDRVDDDDVYQAFLDAYDAAPVPLGSPAAGVNGCLHYWDDHWVQDFDSPQFGPVVLIHQPLEGRVYLLFGEWLRAFSRGGPDEFGAPTDNVAGLPDGNVQNFDGGSVGRMTLLQKSNARYAWPVYGPTLDEYERLTREQGALGWPLSFPYDWKGSTRVTFENGYILCCNNGTEVRLYGDEPVPDAHSNCIDPIQVGRGSFQAPQSDDVLAPLDTSIRFEVDYCRVNDFTHQIISVRQWLELEPQVKSYYWLSVNFGRPIGSDVFGLNAPIKIGCRPMEYGDVESWAPRGEGEWIIGITDRLNTFESRVNNEKLCGTEDGEDYPGSTLLRP